MNNFLKSKVFSHPEQNTTPPSNIDNNKTLQKTFLSLDKINQSPKTDNAKTLPKSDNAKSLLNISVP